MLTEAELAIQQTPDVGVVLIDTQDNIWAGTWGGGAARWDGKAWRNLTTRDGLAGNIVYSVAQDREGRIWVGTWTAGLAQFEALRDDGRPGRRWRRKWQGARQPIR